MLVSVHYQHYMLVSVHYQQKVYFSNGKYKSGNAFLSPISRYSTPHAETILTLYVHTPLPSNQHIYHIAVFRS